MGEKIKARIEKNHCLLDSFLVRPKAGTGLGKNMPYFTRQPFHIIGMHMFMPQLWWIYFGHLSLPFRMFSVKTTPANEGNR